MEVLAYDRHGRVRGEVGVEFLVVVAVGEHFFDLIGGRIGQGHDGYVVGLFNRGMEVSSDVCLCGGEGDGPVLGIDL